MQTQINLPILSIPVINFKFITMNITDDESDCQIAAEALNTLETQGYKYLSMTTQTATVQDTGVTVGTFVLVPNSRPLKGRLLLRNFVINDKSDLKEMRAEIAALKQQGYRVLAQNETTIWEGKGYKITNKQVILRG